MIEHDGCKTCKHFNPKEVVVSSSSYCYECEGAHQQRELQDKYEPMTNADRIRAMSDEELAVMLFNGIDVPDNTEHNCNGVLEWLRSEAESVEESL